MSAVVAQPVSGGPAAVGAVDSPRFLRRLLRRPIAVICLAYLLLVTGVAIIAPLVMPDIARQQAGDLARVRQGPIWSQHLLGTDALGRDVLDRLLVGARPSMLGVAEALVVALLISVPLGLSAGYFGGWVDRVVGWWTDLSLALPGIAVLLVVLSVFRASMVAGMVALGILGAPGLARIVRSATLPVREELYIAAAQVSGLSRTHIIGRHVLSRVAGPVIVLSSWFAAAALLAQTGLSFLGLIVTAPAPSWGGMVSDGSKVVSQQPWLIWPPGIAITLTILAFGLLGDAVRDATAEGWSAAPHQVSRRQRTRARVTAAESVSPAAPDSLLSVENLTVAFLSRPGPVTVVDAVSFDIRRGETVGLVGESGCGKTVTAMSLLGLLPANGQIVGGRINFDGRDLAAMSENELRTVRGREIGLISQEPMVSLTPGFRVGWQLALAVRTHHGVSRRAARARAVELLRSVQLPEPELVAQRYPHELSGGMAQRVAIARALAGEPKLLIADEPTTALDVTVQAEILELLRELKQERGMAILLVTHDWGVVADLCDRAVVMYAGQVVERAPLTPLFHEPMHPYTHALLASNPHHAPDAEALPVILGSVPKPGLWPQGCHFHPRCSLATSACQASPIPLEQPIDGRETRCIHHDLLAARP
jgi:peptide/nickel transport system permease protein